MKGKRREEPVLFFVSGWKKLEGESEASVYIE
jgi:hypothetical protein